LKLFFDLFIFKQTDIKDGVTVHLVIRAPKSDTTAAATAAPTASATATPDSQQTVNNH